MAEEQAARPWYIVNVEVVVERGGRYLAVTRSASEEIGAGDVSLPGGKVDLDLSAPDILEATARREVLEETGLALADPVVYVESHTFGTPDTPVLDVVMLARAMDGEVTASPDEVEHVEWLTFGDLMEHPKVQPWTKESLRRADELRHALGWS
jgi:8-oxo-dGTP pyrophosphatase MutT (NUDIX family)